MAKEQRRHPRKPSAGHLRVYRSGTGGGYKVSLGNVSLGGCFVRTEDLPDKGENISFEILDRYGLKIADGRGRVVRVVAEAQDKVVGFAIEFSEELELAMFDFLAAVMAEE